MRQLVAIVGLFSSHIAADADGMRRIFLVRHAERLDHASPEWAAHASRPHDSPLSKLGVEQAELSGEHLLGRKLVGTVYVRSSPLVRCVQTAAALTRSLGMPQHPVQIDEALCEEEPYLRPRMMGTHRHSVPAGERVAVAPTCDAPRGVCQPVLLRAGDLISIHPHIDPTYCTSACVVAHDAVTGAELNGASGLPQTAQQRAQAIVDHLDAVAPPGGTTVLVTHGAFARRLGEILIGEAWANFGYAEAAELVCDGGEDGSSFGPGAWRVVGRWAPAGDAGRSTTRLD